MTTTEIVPLLAAFSLGAATAIVASLRFGHRVARKFFDAAIVATAYHQGRADEMVDRPVPPTNAAIVDRAYDSAIRGRRA